jgi:anti-sigma regulatory factor (Ser/Thr protein kinase)
MPYRPRSPHQARQPSRAVLDLGAVPTAPGCARAWTRQVLWEWRLVGISDTTDLIVTELTTNAMLISRQEGQPFIRLILTRDQGELVILVRDFCPGAPQPGNAEADDENGRGIFIVQSISDRFGWSPADDGSPGKVVWAALCAPKRELHTRKEPETDDHPERVGSPVAADPDC